MCERLSHPRDASPEEFKDRIRRILTGRTRRIHNDPALICAAVLVPLLWKDGEWHVLVTQRTQTVGHHKGQISFPGGACEPQDGDKLTTALRETFEEVGIAPESVEVLGAADDYQTISSFSVTPFVGIVPYPYEPHLNREEVEGLVEVPLSFLRDPAHLRVERREYQGRSHEVLFWDYGPHMIWGATAQMLKEFLDLIS